VPGNESDTPEVPPADPELLAFAVDLAERAGRLARERFFAGPAGTRTKADGTEVTESDVAVEEYIRAELGRRTPDDEVYGEEAGTTAGTSGRRWIIDPIDGTYYFVRRIPVFATMLAFEDEHGPAIGVLNHPVAEEIVYAGRGLGCWRRAGDLTPARVSTRTRLRGARTAMANPGTWSAELVTALHRQVFLSPAGDTPLLLTGEIDAMVVAGAPMGYEDVAPLPVLVTEAGGRVTDLTGAPVLTGDGSVLATNGLLHDELLALVADIPHGRDWRALTGDQDR
jgi:histidinol-phosphatase